MLHLVCGDGAAEALRAAMAAGALPAAPIRVLPDDLAVGPLADIDTPPCQARACFWHQLGGAVLRERPIAAQMSAEVHWLRAPDVDAVRLWHGDSASEQLMLRRVCALLPPWVQLQAVAGGSGECRCATRQAIAMLAPSALAALPARTLDDTQRRQLGGEWRHWNSRNDELRLWLDGRLQGADYTHIDNHLLAACEDQWRSARRVIGQTMAGVEGLFVSDLLAAWRLRQLTVAGRLGTRGKALREDLEVRLA